MYPTSNGSSGNLQARARKERKVSVVFRHTDWQQHCAGVECLALSSNGQVLFSASRDASVKRWNVGSSPPTCTASYEGHIDWVNGITLLPNYNLLVSCSNDKTVKLWSVNSPGQCKHTFSHHSDYVTCVAAAPAQGLVASAGLRAEVFMVDLQANTATPLHQPTPSTPTSPTSTGAAPAKNKGSIYALAMNQQGTLLGTGTTESVIRILDPRSADKVMKLKGHTDNIRCLQFSGDSSLLLSAGSDATIRLWDLGQQRCVQTLSVHSSSIWALHATDTFSMVYSAGKDQKVFRTSLHSRMSELLFVEEGPVSSMVLNPVDESIWVSTNGSTINKWHMPRDVMSPASSLQMMRGGSGRFVVNASTARMRQSVDGSSSSLPEPTQSAPAARIQGAASVVQHKVLADKRHILVRDSCGVVSKWDVLTGGPVPGHVYGQVDFYGKLAELFEPVSTPTWFSSDNKLGTISMHLEPPSCFSAEVYAQQLGIPNVSDDLKCNYGTLVLRGCFERWMKRHQQITGGQHMNGERDDGYDQDRANGDDTSRSLSWPQYWRSLPPAVVSHSSSGQFWRVLTSQFTGMEKEGEEIPMWVADCVLRNIQPTSKELKCAFILHPAEGSNLPSLLQSRLNAPRILEVRKVANYCATKLAEMNPPVRLAVHTVSWDERENNATNQQVQAPSLEIVCNGLAVPYDMSLSSVKQFIWKRSEDVLFHYRVRDPNNPAPLPKLGPS